MKNKRIKINSIEEVEKLVNIENIQLENKLLNIIKEAFNDNISYKVMDIYDFINYIREMNAFNEQHKKICEKIKSINKLYIERIEYERIPTTIDDVQHIKQEINKIKSKISIKIDSVGIEKLNELEEKINNDYIYARDIELLKRMITVDNDNVKEFYNDDTQVKTLIIDIKNEINHGYVKAKKGTVEYYGHIKSYIPRMKRLINNLDKYLEYMGIEGCYKINQTSAIQDSVNMAIAIFNKKELRAISGKNDLENSCKLIPEGKEYFESCKVNKLGELGRGYNRINDSEKKILEEIHNMIQKKEILDWGELVLYSMWEPCPSCYYVISQFMKKYPNIQVKVEFYKEYGER